jgi:hypothetical protein
VLAGGVAALCAAGAPPPELCDVPAALVVVAAAPLTGDWMPLASSGFAGIVSLETVNWAAATGAAGADRLICGAVCAVADTIEAGTAVDTVATVSACVGTVVTTVCELTVSGVSTVSVTSFVLGASATEPAAGVAIAALCGADTEPCAGEEITPDGPVDPLGGTDPEVPLDGEAVVEGVAPAAPGPGTVSVTVAGVALWGSDVAVAVSAAVPGVADALVVGAGAGFTLAGVGVFGIGGALGPCCCITGELPTALARPDTGPALAPGPLCVPVPLPLSV